MVQTQKDLKPVRINILMNGKLHHAMRMEAVSRQQTMREFIEDAVSKELERTEKEKKG